MCEKEVKVIDLDKEFVPVLMKCGHKGYAQTSDGLPYCVMCMCGEPAEEEPTLENREATCIYCRKKEKSKLSLPFFQHRPNKEFDQYYCGCKGWD